MEKDRRSFQLFEKSPRPIGASGILKIPETQLWWSGGGSAENHETGAEQRADKGDAGNCRARQLEGLGVDVAIERQGERTE